MTRPLIGLTCYREQARWTHWDAQADLLPTVYSWAVEEAGGVPLLLPPSTPGAGAAAAVVAGLGGLLVSGGADVEPARYGAEPHPQTSGWREERDEWELALLDAAEHRALPTLGVCRGMQVMAVRSGGVLVQHVPDVVGHDGHRPVDASYGETSVRVEPGSRLHAMVGDRVDVHCHHHQAVRSHPGFRAVAWAGDGILEAMEEPGDRYCVAVQWHPEMAVDAGLFAGLVRAAARH